MVGTVSDIRSTSCCDLVSFRSGKSRCQGREDQRERHQDAYRRHSSPQADCVARQIVEQRDRRDEQEREHRGDDQIGGSAYPSLAEKIHVGIGALHQVLLHVSQWSGAAVRTKGILPPTFEVNTLCAIVSLLYSLLGKQQILTLRMGIHCDPVITQRSIM
jgi:hypothetical protein